MNYNIIYKNKMMDEYKSDIENVDLLLSATGDDMFSSIIEHTHRVGETVIFDTDNISDSDVDWERIFRFTNNYTGYEIGCNEFSVPIDRVENISIKLLAFDFLNRLKSKFSDNEFVVYFMVCDKNLEFRFHVFRENEGFWIDNFNEIKCPFLCIKE